MTTRTKKLRDIFLTPVNDWMYRGRKPKSDAEMEQLRIAGIKTVVCLRWRNRVIAEERAAAEKAGLQFTAIRLNYWHLPEDAVDQFLRITDDESLRPIYVHCTHGADRTGLMIAMYRVLRDKWRLRDAYNEMVMYGFRRFRLMHLRILLLAYTLAHKNGK
jgi:protein tyrosine/serine phosphatase